MEKHPRQFVGTFAPTELHDLVESGDLPALAAWLAMVILSLTKRRGWCWASNAYLALKIRKNTITVKRLLTKMEDVHLLRSRWEGKQRQLQIDLSLAAKKKRRKTYTAKSRRYKNVPSDATKMYPLTVQKCTLSNGEKSRYAAENTRSNGKHRTSESRSINLEEEGGRVSRPHPPRVNGFSGEHVLRQTNGFHANGKEPSEDGVRYAMLLKKIIRARKSPIMPSDMSLKNQAAIFDKIIKTVGKDRVASFFEHYPQVVDKFKKPTITGASQLQARWDWAYDATMKHAGITEDVFEEALPY